MTTVQDRLPGAIAPLANGPFSEGNTLAIGGLPVAAGDDSIRRFPRPTLPHPGIGGPAGLIQQLLAIIQQLLSMLGLGSGLSFPNGAQTYFQNADASSTGDPHLAFNGTDLSGNAQHAHFDSMSGHADLLDSDSFAGGYGIATLTTQPGANGVTYNERATVSSDYGRTQVSLDKGGDAYVLQNGRRFSVDPGRSYDLGNGESVTRRADGSLEVRDRNAEGGSIVTLLTENGQGVDVHAHAYGVDLGGDLLRGSAQD